MGRLPTDAEWEVMDEPSTGTTGRWREVRSGRRAAELLAARRAAGLTQSLCSLAPHAELVPMISTHGIDRHFVRIDGRVGPSNVGKAAQMARHLASLDGWSATGSW